MIDLNKHAARVGGRLEVQWTDDRVEEALLRLHARRRARRVAVAVGGVVLVAAAVVAVVVMSSAPARQAVVAPAAPGAPAPSVEDRAVRSIPTAALASAPIALGEGSIVTPLDGDTRLETREISPTAATILLHAGSARFEVEHRPSRVFRVVAGDVTIIDTGTRFTVTRNASSSIGPPRRSAMPRAPAAPDLAIVEVLEGSVRVEWGAHAADMAAGERRVFPPPAVTPPAEVPAEVLADRPAPVKPPTPAPRPPDEDDVEALLAKADDARFRGDSAGAVALLRRVVALHAADERAPLAAFTLGRLYLDSLRDPGQAARAFAKARSLAPAGQLAEDALAREVEAWAKADDAPRARERAQAYLAAYPEGRRVAEVKRSAGLP